VKRTDAPPPEGLLFYPEIISAEEEQAIAANLAQLDWREIRMHGVVAKRRVAHFGLLYAYEGRKVEPGPPMPDYLLSLRARVASLTGVPEEAFKEALATEYRPGAVIGWHRDAPMFDVVTGVSLLSPSRMRFQTGTAADRKTSEVLLEPRSMYALTGDSRTKWQHSIPAVKALRYSVTFRTLRATRS
jgi:alkylated DNA repair protein (DNA oxidative demethylase)